METSVKDGDRKRGVRPVGVRFKPCGRIYSFDPGGLELAVGEKVVVESMFGLTIGTVVQIQEEPLHPQKELKPILRKATEEDIRTAEGNKPLEAEAMRFCLERIAARGLPMKLVSTEATLDKKRIIFYFTADTRIDFRELVKDLASKFRTRIEMRQIGVRDEAKLIGGVGVCGRELCCRTFLSNFAPISIRMAKEQELVLNTSKLSGVCGRLMCCLSYEYEGRVEEAEEAAAEEPMEASLYEGGLSEGFLSTLPREAAGGGERAAEGPSRKRPPSRRREPPAREEAPPSGEEPPVKGAAAGPEARPSVAGEAARQDKGAEPGGTEEARTLKKKKHYFRRKRRRRKRR